MLPDVENNQISCKIVQNGETSRSKREDNVNDEEEERENCELDERKLIRETCSEISEEKIMKCAKSIVKVSPLPNIPSVNSLVCRICQTTTLEEPLISPCNCKGTLANVHLTCLERWLNETSRNYCELCMFRFNAIQTQRYNLWESLCMWIRHPRNRTHVQSDMLISVLLTIVTAGLITVCLLGMHYFVIEGSKLGISQSWTRSAISMFLTIIIIGYLITLYLVIKDQVVPWYNWWKNTVDVRLLLSPSTARITTRTRAFRETSV